jgi:hypothetical protein
VDGSPVAVELSPEREDDCGVSRQTIAVATRS